MDACILIPEINGEPSIFYQELDVNEVIPSKMTEEEKENYEEILLKVLGE